MLGIPITQHQNPLPSAYYVQDSEQYTGGKQMNQTHALLSKNPSNVTERTDTSATNLIPG